MIVNDYLGEMVQLSHIADVGLFFFSWGGGGGGGGLQGLTILKITENLIVESLLLFILNFLQIFPFVLAISLRH